MNVYSVQYYNVANMKTILPISINCYDSSESMNVS